MYVFSYVCVQIQWRNVCFHFSYAVGMCFHMCLHLVAKCMFPFFICPCVCIYIDVCTFHFEIRASTFHASVYIYGGEALRYWNALAASHLLMKTFSFQHGGPVQDHTSLCYGNMFWCIVSVHWFRMRLQHKVNLTVCIQVRVWTPGARGADIAPNDMIKSERSI